MVSGGTRQNQLSRSGFTLAELLVSLLILAEIATFTIPKVLSAQQNGLNKAQAKEVAAMIAGAYQQAQLTGVVSASTRPVDLTPYMNYVRLDTTGATIDSHPTAGSRVCDATTPCLRLHGGGVLWLFDRSFSSTANNYAIEFGFDPDGAYGGYSTDGPSKAVQFTLYYNGFLTTRGQIKPSTCSGSFCGLPYNTAFDPSWFSWN